MFAQMVITDANVITMQTPQRGCPAAQAIAVEHGRIVGVGTNEDIRPLVGPGTQVLSLPGKSVLPGFIDTHVHFTQTGLNALGPSVYDLLTAREVLEVLDQAVRQVEAGEPVLIYGCSILRLDRPLTRVECDRVAPHHPVLIVDPGGHSCVANSRALSDLGIVSGTHGVARDASTGEPTGLLFGRANRLALFYWHGRLSDTVRRDACRRAAGLAVSAGITTVHAMDGGSPDGHGRWPERHLQVLLEERRTLPVRTVIYFQSTRIERALELGLDRIGGCVCLDGAYNDHTAAFREPYTDDPSTRGTLYFSDDELNDFVNRAHKAGLQISMHAIGDAAIDQLLTAYERALRETPRPDHRHRIEHFSLPALEQIDRAARLGVAVGMQPNFAYVSNSPQAYSPAALRLLGPERYRLRHPYRKIVDAGVLVAGGSSGEPMWPLYGIHAVVNHPDEERRLNVYEALSLYTVNAARIGFEENDKGTIETGKLADLVVLDEDPLTTCPARLQDIPVSMTIVGGEVVYSRMSISEGSTDVHH
jgi:predicted amidohydrolase YtcJ